MEDSHKSKIFLFASKKIEVDGVELYEREKSGGKESKHNKTSTIRSMVLPFRTKDF